MSVSHPCVLLVDDHALFRTGLGLMLGQSWPDARVRHAASWGEALLALQCATPDLIMLDIHLPDGHGLADLAVLRQHAPASPVLLMSAESDVGLLQRARAAGAAGFLPKSSSIHEVMAAVRSVLAGEPGFAAIPYAVLSPPGQGVGDGAQAGSEGHVAEESAPPLTGRQIDILRYLGRGTPNKAIARRLGMKEVDVRAEVSWLTELLGASSREEAYATAVARGLLSHEAG